MIVSPWVDAFRHRILYRGLSSTEYRISDFQKNRLIRARDEIVEIRGQAESSLRKINTRLYGRWTTTLRLLATATQSYSPVRNIFNYFFEFCLFDQLVSLTAGFDAKPKYANHSRIDRSHQKYSAPETFLSRMRFVCELPPWFNVLRRNVDEYCSPHMHSE